jgi:hypothetical protein
MKQYRLGDHDDRTEWRADGLIDGVPVSIYYMTTPEDDEVVGEDGDWSSSIDWGARVDRVDLNLCECDRRGITEEELDDEWLCGLPQGDGGPEMTPEQRRGLCGELCYALGAVIAVAAVLAIVRALVAIVGR